jgi:putative transposase
LSDWPVDRPSNWVALVNRDLDKTATEEIRGSIKRDRPLGDGDWVRRMAARLGLQHTLRDRGRPKLRDAR